MSLRIPARSRAYDLGSFMVTILFVTIFFFSLRPATDPDYGWHIANGHHVFDGITFSGKDPYSWTAQNLWIAHEWLTEAVMSIVHELFGATGNSLLAGLMITATFGLVYIGLRAREFSRPVALSAVLVCFAGALRSISVRPHVVQLFFLALSVLLVESYLRKRLSRSRFLVIAGGLGLLWANMHGSFPLLATVLAITAAELVIARDSRWRTVGAAAFVSIAVCIVNPWSYRILGFAVQSLSSAQTLESIDEWKAPVLTEWIAAPFLLQLGLAAIGLALMLRAMRARGIAALPSTIGMLRAPAFAFLALQSGRHVVLFGIANAACIAFAVSWLGHFRGPRHTTRDAGESRPVDPARARVNAIAAIAVAAAVAVAGWRVISPDAQDRALEKHYPVHLIGALERSHVDGDRLFNDYNWGGFLIQRTSAKIFIDGRSELYGDEQLRRYASIIHLEPGWEEKLAELGVTRVLMPASSRLGRALGEMQWRTIARDSTGWLLARPR